MIKHTLLPVLFLLHFVIGHSQQPIICGNSVFSDIVKKNYPDLAEAFQTTFDEALNRSSRGQDPLTVNVVVHIVWKEEAENLADEIILDQMRILNEDFNKMNPDGANLRSIFQPVAGDAGIRFELADIVRVQTDVEFEIDLQGSNLLPEVKHTELGGSDAWNNDLFLNIWVCKIQPLTIFGLEIGQILGFAFPPNNLPNWPADSGAPNLSEDGVVIDYRVFGSNNPNGIDIPGGGGALVVNGRTPVHEVGHYFGLRHIWGDGGILGPNDCAQSDGIDDTPYANAQSAFDCDTNKNTCFVVEPHYNDDVPDLVENFMDYASEDCMNMFTQGQADLMRSVLQGPRSGLLQPFSALPPSGFSAGSFQIIPNPVSGPFHISFDVMESADLSFILTNALGEKVTAISTRHFEAGKHSIECPDPNLPPGIYFLTCVSHMGSASTRLMME
jgi:hypothetical protein